MRESVVGFVGQLRRCWRRPARRRTSSGNGSAAWIELALGRFDSTSFSETIETLECRALLSSAGSLDMTLGIDGFAESSFRVADIAIQNDAKILVTGVSGVNYDNTSIVRYNADGSVETTIATVSGAVPFEGGTLALQSDGKIVLSGSIEDRDTLSRFNKDGTPDVTFGSGGRVEPDFGPDLSGLGFPVVGRGLPVALQPDGKILELGGRYYFGQATLARFNANGALDQTFGHRGLVQIDFGVLEFPTHLVVLPDGRILVAGLRDHLALFRANGSLDPTFGRGGIVTIELRDGIHELISVAVQSDGKIVIAGDSPVLSDVSHSSVHPILRRYNLNGTLDATFGNGGVVVLPSEGTINHLAIQRDNKLIAAGVTYAGGNSSEPLIARLNVNGTLDDTFGNGGLAGGDLGADFDADGIHYSYANRVAVQGENGVVVALVNKNGVSGLARFLTGDLSNNASVVEAGTIPLTNRQFPTPSISGTPRTIIYTVADAPNHGQLRLNSTTLRVGSTFSQADINVGRLSYQHDGSETASDAFDYTVRGTNRTSLPRQTFSIEVAPVNDPPTLDRVSANVAFTENATPLLFARSARVSDPDSSNFDGGQLTVTITQATELTDRLTIEASGTHNGQVSVSDELSPPPEIHPTPPSADWGKVVRFTSSGETRDIGMLFDGETPLGSNDRLFLRFNALATREAVQAVLRQVAFQNTSDDPSPLTRSVTITLTDGDGGTSNITHTQVRMIPVDDRPRLEQFTSSIDAVATEPARRLMPQATMLDPDLKRLDGATLVVRASPTTSIIPGDGVWLSSANSTIRVDDRIVATVSRSGFQMSVRFNRNANVDDVTRVLRRVAVEASSTPDRRGTADVWFTDPNRVRSNVVHLTIQSLARTTATPEEVASRLLSQQITGVTVVTHGFQPTEDGDALHPLARAIWEREDATNGDDAAWFLDEDVIGPNGQYVFDTSPFDGQPVLPAIGATKQRGEVVLLFDWAADSNNSGPGYGEANGQRLFQMLVDLGLVDPAQGAANSIPLHFIGHSFGAAVTSEAIERLAYYGVPVDQVTYLDPHDFDQTNIPIDGAQQLFTLGQPQFSDGSQGYGATVWNNVAFADVYYQTEGIGLIPNGRPILGAYNELMNRRVGGSNPHSRVWDDFYLSTVIDVPGLSSDTTSFGGYAFSRIAAGESQRPAPRFFDASQSHVYTSHHLVEFTASGSPIRETNGSFRHGDQAPSESINYAPLWQPA